MQEEISKHTKKVYKEWKNPHHTNWEKAKEIIIEICIIVFAVTLSIWLHSWSEHIAEQTEAKEFLVDLKSDLESDIEELTTQQKELAASINDFTFLYNLDARTIDSTEKSGNKIYLHLLPTLRKTNDGNYEGFKSSGKIGYIENKELKKLILKYYQDNMPKLVEVEQYYNTQLMKLGDLSNELTDKKTFYLSPVTKGVLDMVIQYGKNDISSYDESIKMAKEIATEIDKAINE